jgi:7-keto-8-aminopelargonate synthetase-like enzyme
MSRRGLRHERNLQMIESMMAGGAAAGLIRVHAGDEDLEGEAITVDGHRMLNFGSCSYLGLNTDPRLKRGAIRAVERFGPVFSSSTAYASVDLYADLKKRLERIFEAHVVIPATTTLGHLAALPVLINPDDAVFVDVNAHASIHLTTDVLRGRGNTVVELPHNDVEVLETAIQQAEGDGTCGIWYLADSIYSMYGDTAPVQAISELLDRYPSLHVYFDDAHGFGWSGLHGRGSVLDRMPFHSRMVLAVGLGKAFGSGGAALAFADPDFARRVLHTGGPLTFSGPIHNAQLGAAVASADIHLSPEHAELQSRLHEQIAFAGDILARHRLPVMGFEPTPIWFVRVGRNDQVMDMTRRLMDDGFFINPSAYPAVPRGYGGIRFTHTLHQTQDQIESLVEAIARHLPQVTDEPGVLIDLTTEQAASKQEKVG